MYQQPHYNWGTYHIGPNLPASPLFFGPRCGPPVLPVPSKVYSLYSPVAPRMSHPSKSPAALIPALMAVHPANHSGPVIGMSPVIRSPGPMYHRGPHQQHTGPPNRVKQVLESRETENLRSLKENNTIEHKMQNNHLRNCSASPDLIDLTRERGESMTPAVCRKRSASPSGTERKLKKQREVVDRAEEEKDCRNSPELYLVTPEKFKEAPSRGLNQKDRQLGEKLSPSIQKLYLRHKQTEDWLKRKMKLRKVLHDIIKPIHPHCGLYMVGSSMTGLAAISSDLDLCLVLSETEIDQQTRALDYLSEILRLLKYCNFITKCQLIHAKVPILKFVDEISGVEVDLNVNNIVGIRNTQLINNYSRLDQRVKPLCLVVKLWAKVQGINDPFNRTLSSYSLILMILHYLQVGCHPPVLPCLHKLMPNHFSNTSDVRCLELTLDLPPFSAMNQQCLGELLLGFFNYYGHVFNFQEKVISVRLGGTLPKEVAMNCRSPKNRPSQWNYVCIEEPFDRTNTAHSVFDKFAFNRIRNAFATSLEKLRKTRDLDSVLPNESYS